ncbi:hypothetical protein FQA39_LY15880 [Lamprigera yunnana]|nr:hypothetical protein FQA39_LY15880 [Lamprigera yunnana]
MSQQVLTREQQVFLDECQLEFSDRYTDADIEYKKVCEEGIPPPPIMYPWYERRKMIPYKNRERGGYKEHGHGHVSDEERNLKTSCFMIHFIAVKKISSWKRIKLNQFYQTVLKNFLGKMEP